MSCNQSDIAFSITNTLELLGRGPRRDSDVRCPTGGGEEGVITQAGHGITAVIFIIQRSISQNTITVHITLTKICRLLTSDNGILSLPNTNK